MDHPHPSRPPKAAACTGGPNALCDRRAAMTHVAAFLSPPTGPGLETRLRKPRLPGSDERGLCLIAGGASPCKWMGVCFFPQGIAGAAIAALALLFIASPTWMPDARQGAAFAEVQEEAVAAVKSFRYRILNFQGEKDPHVSTVIAVRGVGSHSEASSGAEQITNLKAQRMLWLDHRARKATLYQIYPEGSGQFACAFHEKLLNLPAHAKPLGEGELDGKRVLEFEFTDCGRLLAAVDPETKLPLRMEFASDQARPRSDASREVITDFLFDAPVNEALFDVSVPAGYAVARCEEPANRKPIDMKSLVVSTKQGVGFLPIGASKAQVIAAFGPPDQIEQQRHAAIVAPAPGKSAPKKEAAVVFEELHYNSLGFELSLSSADGVTQFRTFDVGPLARPFLGKTDAGIAVGASIDDVVRAYGPPERRIGIRDGVLDYFHQGWSFVFYGGKLAWFTASKPMSDEIEIEVHDDGSWTERVKPGKNSQ